MLDVHKIHVKLIKYVPQAPVRRRIQVLGSAAGAALLADLISYRQAYISQLSIRQKSDDLQASRRDDDSNQKPPWLCTMSGKEEAVPLFQPAKQPVMSLYLRDIKSRILATDFMAMRLISNAAPPAMCAIGVILLADDTYEEGPHTP